MTSLASLDLSANNLSGDLPVFLSTPPQETKLGWNCLYASNPAVAASQNRGKFKIHN